MMAEILHVVGKSLKRSINLSQTVRFSKVVVTEPSLLPIRPCSHIARLSNTDEVRQKKEEDTEAVWFKDDESLPKRFKEIEVHAKSTRVDAIAGVGFNLSRQEIQRCIGNRKLHRNGTMVMKNAEEVVEGDCLDLLCSETDSDSSENQKLGKRLRVLSIVANKSKKSKKSTNTVALRVWRQNCLLPG